MAFIIAAGLVLLLAASPVPSSGFTCAPVNSTAFGTDMANSINPYEDLFEYLNGIIVSTDTRVPPVDLSSATPYPIISANFTIIALHEVDEKSNLVTMNGAVVLSWSAAPLGYVWNNQWPYCNLPSVTYVKGPTIIYNDATLDYVWTPKMTIMNSRNLMDWRDSVERSPITINSDGTATWALYSSYQIDCDLRLTSFPFDYQTCMINVTFEAEDFFVQVPTSGAIIPICSYSMLPNAQWTWVGSRIFVISDSVTSSFVIKFVIKRKSTFYVMAMLVPTILLDIAGAAIFIIPAGHGEKMGVCFTVILSFFWVFSVVVGAMPTNSTDMPVLYSYVVALFAIGISGSVYAAILSNLAESTNDTRRENIIARAAQFLVSAATPSTTKRTHRVAITKMCGLRVTRRRIRLANNIGFVCYIIAIFAASMYILIVYLLDSAQDSPQYLSGDQMGLFKMPNDGNNIYYMPTTTQGSCGCIVDSSGQLTSGCTAATLFSLASSS